MPNHMTALGFQASTEEEFADLAMTAATQGEPIQVSGGTYYCWASGVGIELWAQVDQDGRLIGLNPHFSGAARMRVRLIEPIAREHDSALDGAFYGWADPEENVPVETDSVEYDSEETYQEDGQYPFVFDLPDFKCHESLTLPAIVTVQLAAFAHELRAFENDETFHADAADEDGETLKMAPESCIPSGTFSSPAESTVIFNGHVLETAQLTNPHTERTFYWARVRTLGGEYDVVADPEIVEGAIVAGGVIGGSAWLSGRII
ncbi:MAG TPA: hypothetical protein VH393_13640 [Ktedonobacterales bacterium]